jgi:predicted nucleic acid-binding protein
VKVLVDTSIWISHIRKRDSLLDGLLFGGDIVSHPFVIGELALGKFKGREKFVAELAGIRQAAILDPEFVLTFIERAKLSGSGIGYVDAHLLASAVANQLRLWTGDLRVEAAARRLGVAFPALQ